MSHKKLFQPKLPECTEQCMSCPFRMDNNAEFGAILLKLKQKFAESGPIPTKLTAKQINSARLMVFQDVEQRGDFICHYSVYNIGETPMTMRPATEYRQCKGATEFYQSS